MGVVHPSLVGLATLPLLVGVVIVARSSRTRYRVLGSMRSVCRPVRVPGSNPPTCAASLATGTGSEGGATGAGGRTASWFDLPKSDRLLPHGRPGWSRADENTAAATTLQQDPFLSRRPSETLPSCLHGFWSPPWLVSSRCRKVQTRQPQLPSHSCSIWQPGVHWRQAMPESQRQRPTLEQG